MLTILMDISLKIVWINIYTYDLCTSGKFMYFGSDLSGTQRNAKAEKQIAFCIGDHICITVSIGTADALEPKFSCKLCQDTGTVNGRTCSCVHKVMQQLRRQEIEQLSSLSISSFDTMELRYYPNTMDAQNGVNIRAYMGRLLDGLKQYAEDFSPTENESLMLIGNAGLGKTHAALAIAGLVLEQGHDVIYVSSPDFFGKIEASRFDPSGDADTLLRTASTADLLILDDLGTEFVTPYFITVFYSLLNNRLGAGLPTIITTNITDGALLEKRYTEKISSRLSAFIPFRFLGEDIRPQKAAE